MDVCTCKYLASLIIIKDFIYTCLCFHDMKAVAGTIEDQSLEYRESEINEEEFTPDLQKVEQVRLEAIVKSRSLLRDTELVSLI